MSTYSEASQLKEMLKGIVNEMIENHSLVKSAIKAKKATVDSVDTTDKTVAVRFPFDTSLVTLPYNPQMESYLTTGTVKGKVVSVWFYQDLNNGIVMQDGSWGMGTNSDLLNLIYPIGSIYMSVNDASPQILFGGIWEKIEGRFLLGSNGEYALGATGGEATHAHSAGNLIGLLANGSGNIDYKTKDAPNTYDTNMRINGSGGLTQNNTHLAALEVGGDTASANNMPPYIAVNIWKRTA